MKLQTKITVIIIVLEILDFIPTTIGAAKKKPDQFDYKVRESGVDFGCFGFRMPNRDGYHTTFYVMDQIGRRPFEPFGAVEIHYPDEADVEQKIQTLQWNDLKFLPHECLTDEILQQWT